MLIRRQQLTSSFSLGSNRTFACLSISSWICKTGHNIAQIWPCLQVTRKDCWTSQARGTPSCVHTLAISSSNPEPEIVIAHQPAQEKWTIFCLINWLFIVFLSHSHSKRNRGFAAAETALFLDGKSQIRS